MSAIQEIPLPDAEASRFRIIPAPRTKASNPHRNDLDQQTVLSSDHEMDESMTQLATAWKAVHHAARRLRGKHLRSHFADEPDRFLRFSTRLDDLLIDYSKERLDTEALDALLTLADRAGIEAQREAMFDGDRINQTEGRAVLHTALRAGRDLPIKAGRSDVRSDVSNVLNRFLDFAESVRSGAYASVSGRPFTHVINVGIGGSDLGPAMAVQALAPFHDGPRLCFVSNVDGAHLTDELRSLSPERTLVIVASKTFTTLETMANARSARAWLAEALGGAAGHHMAAVSSNLEGAAAFGIPESRAFGFWDWVGGRYSLWSSVGLPLAIAIGANRFREFLDGARAMDRHFREAPLQRNLPVLLALVAIWRRNAMGWPTVALIPYDQRLARLPAYVQQLEMESNGKRIRLDGQAATQSTAPVVWGEPGTNAQHSFFQMLHQGTDVVPVDFLLAAQPQESLGNHHTLLGANALAQSAALAFGKTEDEVRREMRTSGMPAHEIDRLAPHRTFPGDRPSTTILYRQLDPAGLGRLISLFEHRVFVQAAIWGINAFDQWGVELGKSLATRILPALEGDATDADLDASTSGLMAHLAALRGPAASGTNDRHSRDDRGDS